MREPRGIILASVGGVYAKTLEYLRSALESLFGLPARVAQGELPLAGWDPGRRQYHSPEILDRLREAPFPEREPLLGVTEADLYAESMNFIFGQAELAGRLALVSLHRLHPEFYGRPPDPELFLRRALTECVHELGHTFGFGHCREKTCVMHFSKSITASDRKGPGFCEHHGHRLRESVRSSRFEVRSSKFQANFEL